MSKEENQYITIDLEKTAVKLTEHWFLETYEEKLPEKELYDTELVEGHNMWVEHTVKPQYAILYFQKLQYFRELLTFYEK